MPQPVAQAVEAAPVVEAADLVVRVQVGDVADLRDGEPAGSAPRRGPADLQRAEAGCKVAQLCVGQPLVAEDHHCVAVDGRPDAVNGRGVERQARSIPPISAANAGLSAEISIDIAGSTCVLLDRIRGGPGRRLDTLARRDAALQNAQEARAAR